MGINQLAMSKTAKLIVTTILVVAAGSAIYQSRRAADAQARFLAGQEQSTPLTAQVEQLTQERDQAIRQVANLRAELDQLQKDQSQPELLRLRGEVGQLRRTTQELSNLLALVIHGETISTATNPADYLFYPSEVFTYPQPLSTQDHVPDPNGNQKVAIHGSPTNGTLLIAWRKNWYPAEILETRYDQHLIRYTGYGSNWDEWVNAERMGVYDAQNQSVLR